MARGRKLSKIGEFVRVYKACAVESKDLILSKALSEIKELK